MGELTQGKPYCLQFKSHCAMTEYDRSHNSFIFLVCTESVRDYRGGLEMFTTARIIRLPVVLLGPTRHLAGVE